MYHANLRAPPPPECHVFLQDIAGFVKGLLRIAGLVFGEGWHWIIGNLVVLWWEVAVEKLSGPGMLSS